MELRFQEKIFHSKRMSFYMFGIPFTSKKFRRLTGYQIYAPDSIKLASQFQKGTLKIYAAESNVILRMFSNFAPLNKFCP